MNATPAERLQIAFQLHQAGKWAEAEGLYRRLSQEAPHWAEPFQLLGALLLQMNRPAEAVPYLETAVAINANSTVFWTNLGIAYARTGQHEPAIAAYRKSLHLEPNNIEVLRNLGTIFMRLRRYSEAREIILKGVALQPDSIEFQLRLGIAHFRLKDDEASLRAFEKVLAHQEDHLQALSGVGQILLKEEPPSAKALKTWERLVQLDPDNPSMHNNLGTILKNLERFEEAVIACEKSLTLCPEFFPALCNVGVIRCAQGRFEEGRDYLRRSVVAAERRPELEPHNPVLAAAYSKIDEITWKEFVCTANCQLASVEGILGNTLLAHQAVDRSIAISPEHTDSHMMRAFLYLQDGEFLKGWPEYEWRKKGDFAPRSFRAPEWRGELAAHQTLLVHAEQGFGDSIQFCRYAKLLKSRVGKVIWLSHRPLVPLLRSCQGIDELIIDGESLPPFDLHVPLMSLPGVFRTSIDTVPNTVPYLSAREDLVSEWKKRLEPWGGFRIGIAWQGNKEFANDRYRRVPLKEFKAIAEVPGVQLFSLQKGDGTEQLQEIDFDVVSFDNVDTVSGAFMDTAAIMTNLDLVISPCTATPHLAGALGIPVWLAKSFAPEWRWMAGDHPNNPWYPTMKMFRQPRLWDWSSVFARMVEELPKRIALKSNPSASTREGVS